MAGALVGILFVVGTLLMIWVALPIWISSLGKRIDALNRQREREHDWSETIAALLRRVSTLEASLREADTPPRPRPTVEPIEPPVAPAPSPVVVPAPVIAAASVVVQAPTVAPAPAIVVLQPVTAAAASAIVATAELTATEEPQPPDASSPWEIVVGANWLNRIGVVAIVVGIALGVAYTVGHTGPAGRVAIGYAMSALLLGAGVWLERRPLYRSYAYGLVAGGWAGGYFTTYAAHAVEAARVINSDVAATAALTAVAAGMVAHSLRYRSQTVTGLAYFIAYATLALTPLSGFALTATVPLSASLLIVAERFGWWHVSVLGIVSTYGVFGLRGAMFPGQLDPDSLAPYLALSAYWLTFEIGDIAALRRAAQVRLKPGATATVTSGFSRTAPLFALNAVGFTGAALLQFPSSDPLVFSRLITGAAAVYLVTAVVRAKMLGWRSGADTDIETTFSGASQGAIGIAAAFALWAIGLRFSGPREAIGYLLVAELLFVAGIVAGDRIIRLFGAGASVIVGLRALGLISRSSALLAWPWPLHVWTPVMALVVLAFYVNREVLRTRQIRPLGIEWGYTPVANLLAMQILVAETAAPYLGLTLMAAAWLLVEAGIRRGAEYRYQAYLISVIALGAVFDRHLGGRPGLDAATLASEAWRALPVMILLAYTAAVRLVRLSLARRSEAADARTAAGIAAVAGTAMLVLFEWRVAPTLSIAPLWAATALVLVVAGVWRGVPLLVGQGHVLVLAAGMRAMAPVAFGPPRQADATTILSALLAVAALFVAGLVGRRSLSGRSGTPVEIEDTIRLVTLVAATAAIVVMIFQEIQPSAITLTLGLAGVVLVISGLPLAERALRLSGLAVFAIGIARLFAIDLVRLEGLARILSFIISGLALLGVSWVYTRFRQQIRQYL